MFDCDGDERGSSCVEELIVVSQPKIKSATCQSVILHTHKNTSENQNRIYVRIYLKYPQGVMYTFVMSDSYFRDMLDCSESERVVEGSASLRQIRT